MREIVVDAELAAKLHDLIHRARKLQHHSRECRQRAEELTVQADHLFTEKALIEESRTIRNVPNAPINHNRNGA